jgi:hypothetical protein
MGLLIGTVIMAGCASWPRSRDFSAVDQPPPPAPRLGNERLYLSLGLGAEWFAARWQHGIAPQIERHAGGFGPEMSVRMGAVVREGLALYGEGMLAVFATGALPVGAVAAGGGAIWYVRPDGPWHVDLGVTHLDTQKFESWTLQVGTGFADRRGHADRTWTLAARGSIVEGAGWLVGLGLTHRWSYF